ncbi:MAG: NFACT RNA binding domain-containing protein [Candidatus Baltobacteraceae bacterium]
MYTDWLLVRRLAWELQQRFAGGRVRDVGQLEDGRFALAVWSHGAAGLLCADAFAGTPVVTIEDRDLPIAVEPGFVRAAGAALRGTTLLSVRSRKDDRLLRLDFGSRSRFGVQDGYSLICELVPRFGNIVLLKEETVVAAAKEFAPADNALRSIQNGDVYEPPPLRAGNATPLLDEAQAASAADVPPDGDLYVYRREGALVQAHVLPLPQFAGFEMTREPSLLALLSEARSGSVHRNQSDRVEKRRRDLQRELGRRAKKARGEFEEVQARLQRAASREALRESGQAIYATLHELPAEAREAQKERASDLFARYKKAASSVAHLQRRGADLQQTLSDLEALQWELERADDAHLDEVAQAVSGSSGAGESKRASQRKRKPLQFSTAAGSRIFVGRTPVENADLTFRLARPDDLWFHVQNQPGAHVILQRDDKTAAPQDDILSAAALAAFHSKARNAPKVTVDYTERKHVRKRPAAAPGLVFYTHPRSVLAEPRESL